MKQYVICDNNSFWNVVNCRCDHKKAAKLTTGEECEEIVDDITQNKTALIKKLLENCKPFVASSILFVSVSVILTGIVVYLYVKSKNKNDLLY